MQDGRCEGGRYAPVQVFGIHADQAQVDDLRMADVAQQPPEDPRRVAPARARKRGGEGRNGEAEADHPFVFIEDDGGVFRVDDQPEIVDHQLLHAVGERNSAVEAFVRLVEQFEDAVLVEPHEIFRALRFSEMQLVAAEDEVRKLVEVFLVVFGGVDPELEPVDLLGEAQLLDVMLIIVSIVLLFKSLGLVEAFDQQAFALQVGERQRSAEGVHALLQRPVLDRLEEGFRYGRIVDDVEVAEAGAPLTILRVGGLLDDALDATGHPAVLVCVQADPVAAVRIDEPRLEHLPLVGVQRRDEKRIAFVEPEREFQEFALLAAGECLFYFDHRCFASLRMTVIRPV